MANKSVYIVNRSGNYFKIKVDKTNLEALKELMKQKMVAQVGVLGESQYNRKGAEPRKVTETSASGKSRTGEKESTLTNADIGLAHEKGSVTRRIPRRSFIEMPLTMFLSKEVEKAIPAIRKAFESLDLRKANAILGLAGESVILQAFNSSGFGKWAPNSPVTVKRKGSSRPLIDTAQLRKSINSRVIAK